jgi:hypothetical protein
LHLRLYCNLSGEKGMRLTPFEVESIIEAFHNHFAKGDHLWLFGSRTDDSKKGGDIDLFIQTQETDQDKIFKSKIAFLIAMEAKIGEQKIDVVISMPGQSLPIYQHAKETGVLLV